MVTFLDQKISVLYDTLRPTFGLVRTSHLELQILFRFVLALVHRICKLAAQIEVSGGIIMPRV